MPAWATLGGPPEGRRHRLLRWQSICLTRMRRPPTAVFVVALAVYLATAAIGVWTAYDRPAAWERSFVLAAAVLLAGVIARTPAARQRDVADVSSALAACLSLYFLVTSLWGATPAAPSWWEKLTEPGTGILRPAAFASIAPDRAAGLLSILLPLSIASAALAWRDRSRGRWLATALCLLVVLGLLASGSRVTWIALVAGAVGVAGAWFWRQSLGLRRAGRVAGGLTLLLVIGLAWGTIYGSEDSALDRAAAALASPDGLSRLALIRDTLDLIEDFPFTGGGLGSFPGLYSRYILAIPQAYLEHSYNLYLDTALSQGPFGLLALAIAFLGGLALSARGVADAASASDVRVLEAAALGGLVVLGVYGLADDPMWAGAGAGLLFLYPAMALGLWRSESHATLADSRELNPAGSRPLRRTVGLLLVACAVGLALRHPSSRSAWHANRAALLMARQELGGWPGAGLLATQAAEDSQVIERELDASLNLNPRNRTALHRLGLLLGARGEWEEAVAALERANLSDPAHRGIRKLLGYAYIWSGDLQSAGGLLSGIPEAKGELEFYAWWWSDQGQVTQAQRATQMLAALGP